ncbi:MAG: TIGR02996 domain-containing protein, partial [Planctomycetia bacterium]|nr:TIGR02996 domain-containing protein [Planctomycetia bacterium]
KKGYIETTPKAGTSDTAAFEVALRANPHDRAGWCAFADYLVEQDEPRGEFMQVQLALEDESRPKKERDELKKKEEALLKKHEKEWIGDLARALGKPKADYGQIDPSGGHTYLFERGVLTTINVGSLNVKRARAIVAATNTTFVRNLFVGNVPYDENDDDEDQEDEEDENLTGPDIPANARDHRGQYPLLRWPQLRYIRRFTWGYPADENYGDWANHRCWMAGDHVHDFVKQMPDIEELRVFAHLRDANKLVALPMPNLRVFELYHGWSYPLEKLAKNATLTNLTQLHCHPHGLEPGDEPYIRLAGLKAVCRSPHLKSLTHLRLRLTDFGDDGAKEIASSGILKRLKVLDLRHGCMTDAGAQTLAACPDLKNLSLLNVSHNAMTKKGISSLRAAGVSVEARHMHTETAYDPEDFQEFLAHGDPE